MRKPLLIVALLCLSIVASAQKKVYNIGILLDERSEDIDPALQRLKNQIVKVVGEDAIINFPEENILPNNNDLKSAEENYQRLLANNTDIILAIGIVNSAMLYTHSSFEKPTILFGAINKDIGNFDPSRTTSGIKNFTYLIDSESFKNDIKTFKDLTDFDTVGIIVEERLVGALPVDRVFTEVTSEVKAAYKLILYNSVDDIINKLDGVDAVYLASGLFFKEREVQKLAEAFIERKLPSFTINGVDQVKSGLMATNQSEDDFEQFLRRISLTVESYINGTPLADMPVYMDVSPRLTINYNTAQSTGVAIKYSLISKTDFVGSNTNTLSEENYNLLDVIDRVLNKNLSLQASKKDVELSAQDVKMANSNYLPSLTAAASGTHNDPDLAAVSNGQNPEFLTAGNLTLQQTIFSAAANTNIAIQKQRLKAQRENYNAEQLNTVLQASQSYFNVLILKANAQIQLANLSLTKRNLELAKQNFESGQSGKSDMLRFRSQKAQNTQAMVEAVNKLQQSFVQLNQVLNNPVDKEIDIEDVEMDKGLFTQYDYDQMSILLDNPATAEPFIAFLEEEAKRNAPELKSLAYNMNAIDRNIRLNSWGRVLPSVALQGQYNYVFDRSGIGSTFPPIFPTPPNKSYNVGLSVSIPIVNQNQTNINRQTALIQKDQININRDNTELSISANVRTGVLDLINQISNIELSTVSEETAKEALELTRSAYSNGSVNVIQLIDAQNNYLNAQLARTNAVYNYLLNALQLERYIGYYFLLHTEEENDAFVRRFLEFRQEQTNNK